jgi:hypothetical protein
VNADFDHWPGFSFSVRHGRLAVLFPLDFQYHLGHLQHAVRVE